MEHIGRYQTSLGQVTIYADAFAVKAALFSEPGCWAGSDERSFAERPGLGVQTTRQANGLPAGDSASLPENRSALTDCAAGQICEYLAGKRREFDLPLQPDGTPFQQRVWSGMQRIPYGQVRSYGELASMIGYPRAARAVGSACGANRILLLIPCHRVVAKNGIGGYGGNIALKRRLLSLEGVIY